MDRAELIEAVGVARADERRMFAEQIAESIAYLTEEFSVAKLADPTPGQYRFLVKLFNQLLVTMRHLDVPIQS